METRNIYVVDSNRNKYVLNTEAETLGQLKESLNAKGIDYTDKQIFEGYSTIELINDSSQLPTNVRKSDGSTTNELLIMIVNPKRKTESGCVNRKEAYEEIKKNREIKNFVEQLIGHSYTTAKTSTLLELVNRFKHPEKFEEMDSQMENQCVQFIPEYAEDLRAVLVCLMQTLIDKKVLTKKEASIIMKRVNCEWVEKEFPTDKEIDEALSKCK